MVKRFLLTLIFILISSCSPPTAPETPLVINREFLDEEITEILIEIEGGTIDIQGEEWESISLTHPTSITADKIKINQGTYALHIEQSSPADDQTLKLNIPSSMRVQVKTFTGQILLTGKINLVDISTTAGDIHLEDFQGGGIIRSGRGDIKVTGGDGDLKVIGEHGSLSVKEFQGPLSISTIMGKIEYSSPELPMGEIQLEADHGPVTASLSQQSDYQIEINSAGGIVICSGESTSRTPTGCTGMTGLASEQFQIRTVSGRIDFSILP